MKKMEKISAIIMAVIGVIVIILGAVLTGQSANYAVEDNSFRYVANEYDADYAAFGGDFYTYVYGASDIIVDELDEINRALETVVRAQDSINAAVTANVLATDALINTVNKVGGMIIISIGLTILAFAVKNLLVVIVPVGKNDEEEIVEEIMVADTEENAAEVEETVAEDATEPASEES